MGWCRTKKYFPFPKFRGSYYLGGETWGWLQCLKQASKGCKQNCLIELHSQKLGTVFNKSTAA